MCMHTLATQKVDTRLGGMTMSSIYQEPWDKPWGFLEEGRANSGYKGLRPDGARGGENMASELQEAGTCR